MSITGKFLSLLTRTKYNPPSARRGFGFSAGVAVTEDSAMQVSAFHRGVTYISTQIAKLPWDIKDANNNVMTGPNGIGYLLDLCPNPEMNAMTWRILAIQTAIIKGNFYCEIERTIEGKPIALWPIPTDNVQLVRDEFGKLFYRVSGYSAPEGIVYLNPSDVFHLKNFHTKDGLVGQGVVAYATETLGISVAADRMAGGLFANSGLPSGVIQTTGVLSDDAYRRVKESWKEQYGGRKAGGVAILEEGSTFQPMNFDPQVLQFLESRKFGVLEIARFLNLPPTKLFDTTAATFSNQEQSNLEVATDVLDAWACMLEIEADVKLLNNRHSGRFTEIDLYSVFRGDMNTRGTYFSKMMGVAAITPNQIRKLEGMPGYGKDGDQYFISSNNLTPIQRQNEIIDAEIKQKTTPPPASSSSNQLAEPQKKIDTQKAEAELNQAALDFLRK